MWYIKNSKKLVCYAVTVANIKYIMIVIIYYVFKMRSSIKFKISYNKININYDKES